MPKPVTLWFTGPSGSGKTTIGRLLAKRLPEPVFLDPGNHAAELNDPAGDHVFRIRAIAQTGMRLGKIVIATFITPLRATRALLREKLGAFIEVYTDCPEAACRERGARIACLYEPPEDPEIWLHTNTDEVTTSANKIVNYLQDHNYV